MRFLVIIILLIISFWFCSLIGFSFFLFLQPAGNYVKMIHNGIEYGDMQLISEAYDLLKTVGNLTNEELAAVFDEWNKSELESFLVEITASIFKKKDEMGDGFLVDKVLDKTGMKVRQKQGAKQNVFSAEGFEPSTSGLWAPHATAAPS